MELKQLRVFVAVAKNLSFSQAAKALFVSQPTLSYQISALEQELNTKLFIRGNPNITLTSKGKLLNEMAQKILKEIDQIEFAMSSDNDNDGAESTLNVALPGFVLPDYFSVAKDILDKFSAKAEDIRIQFRRLDFESSVREMSRGEVDVAFMAITERDRLPTPLLFRPLIHDEYILVYHKKHGDVSLQRAGAEFKLIIPTWLDPLEKDIRGALDEIGISPGEQKAESVFEMQNSDEKVMMLWTKSDFEKYLKYDYNSLDFHSLNKNIIFGALWNNGSAKRSVISFAETI